MTAVAIALAGAYGVYLLYTAVVFGWRGVGIGPPVATRARRSQSARRWLAQAGLGDVGPGEFAAVAGLLALAGATAAFALFGGALPAITAAACTSAWPLAFYRARRQQQLAVAREGWPRIIEEIRLLTGSAGRSIPQAFIEAGRRAPLELSPAFDAAEREWLVSTDFDRTIAVLKGRLGDATADAVCETLVVAHQVGGGEVDRRLAALVEDRILDLQGRKDARARQAGVRFARRFVLIVPVGMAVAGLSIGPGRAAYTTPAGQALVAAGILAVAACWVWAGRLLRLPEEERVFA